MKKSISLIMFLICSIIPSIADTDDSKKKDEKVKKPLKLQPIKQAPDRGPRMPGMPIYGEFVEPMLYLYVDDEEPTQYQLSINKDGVEVESISLSAQDLNRGYEVSVSAPFLVELTPAGGTPYCGEVE